MGQTQYSEFIDSIGFHRWQKEELLKADSRNDQFQELYFWHKLNEVKTKHSEFHNHFISKGIFIQADLKEMIRELSNMMYDAFNEQQIDREFPESRPDRYPKRDALQREGFSKLKAIEAAVQARLWDANKLG